MGNSPGEAESWAEAARLFLKAESVYRKTRLPSYEGCIHAAVHCFLLAIQVGTPGWSQWCRLWLDSHWIKCAVRK